MDFFKEIESLITFLSLIVTIIGLVIAWIIPERIMWRQALIDLNNIYLSYDFAVAVQGIVEFFKEDCNSDVDKIAYAYKKRFIKDFGKTGKNKVSKEENLHYQRRLLSQFYYELDLCTEHPFLGISHKEIRKIYGTSEANLVKILFFMNKAVDDDKNSSNPVIYKNIKTSDRISRSQKLLSVMNQAYATFVRSVERKERQI